MSSVGRAETRSRMVYAASPHTAGTPVACLNCASLRSVLAIIARSSAVSGTTSS